MSAAHTPGPWVIEDGWLQNERGPYVDGRYLSVCMSATCLADGLLITAAPDLLAALGAAVECGMVPKSSAREGGATAHARMVHVADEIRAAIAKALGRTPNEIGDEG